MRRILTLALWLASAAFIGALALPGSAAADKLKVAHSTWVGYGPFFIARDKGYFKDEGVDVELILMEDPKLRFAALRAGRLDMLASTVDTGLLYLKEPGDLQYVMAIDDSNGGDGVVARKEIKSIADLKGRKVAFNEGSVSQFYINVLLSDAGLTQDDIQVVNMTAGDAGSAFVAGKVDAAVTWEPWLSRGKATPHGHLLTDSSKTPGLITDVLIVPRDRVVSRAKDIKGFVRAWYRAVDFQKAHPDEANKIMAEGVGGWLKKPKVFAETLTGIVYYDRKMNRDFFGTPAAPGPLQKTVQKAIDIWSRFGKLQVKVKPADLINYSFVGG